MKKYLAGLLRRKEIAERFKSLDFQPNDIAVPISVIFCLMVIGLIVYSILKFTKIL